MDTLTSTDSDSEEEMRPSFGKPSTEKQSVALKAGVKRPYPNMVPSSGQGDGNGHMNYGPSDFLKKKSSSSMEMSEAAKKMMAKMGHKVGEGLGKHGQGRTEIVEASQQRGRRGLGMVVSGFEPSDVDWNFEMEEVAVEEEVEWLPPFTEAIPSFDDMMSWKALGAKKRTLDDETDFCSEESLSLVLSGKNVFDQLEPEEMRRARTRSNPYETIRGAFFLNRAAMKMANIDAVLDFMFTNPKTPTGQPLIGPDDLLYFADICAGPGGFSEYVLWRKKGEAKGFGMTLKGGNDFKLEDFFAGPPEMFEPHYGVNGLDGDGDIFNPKNQAEFIKFVLANTDNEGVHFVMADGGFSVEGQENIQEILSKQLYLCQFLVAISILRTGGHFVCKLFDLFTPFSVGLVYLMNMIFEQTTIMKPVTSRPANSERYIVCKSLKFGKEPVVRYMHSINLDLCKYMSSVSTTDLLHIVPLTTLMNDEPFFAYIVNSNESLAKIQAINLKKIQIFTANGDLYEHRQSDIRTQCLEKWKVPDKVRAAPGRPDPNAVFKELIKEEEKEIFSETGQTLSVDNLGSIRCASCYSCVVKGEGASFYILGCGRSMVYKWDGKAKSKWQKLEGMRVELPTKTLLEVQTVTELRGEGKGQRRQTTIHVLDAFFLFGQDVRHLSFEKRFEKLKKFVKALRKPTRSDLSQLHTPDVFPLEEIGQIFNRLDMRVVKGSANKPRLCYRSDTGSFLHPSGIDIVKTVKEPWIRSQSKSTGKHYWYNIHNKKSVYECPSESVANVSDCKKDVLHWQWVDGVKVHPDQTREGPGLISRDAITHHLHKIQQR